MAPNVLRHPVLVAGVVAGLGAGLAAPAATAASTPPSTVSSNRLLGGLLDTVTGPLLDVITPLVDGSTGTLPAILPAGTVDALTDALTGGLDELVPADVAKLLTGLTPAQIAQLVQSPAAVAPLLSGLLPSLTSLAGDSAPSADAVTGLLAQLTAVLSGGLPTDAAGLGVLTGVLDQVTALLQLPGVASLPVVGPLVEQLTALAAGLADGPTKDALTNTVKAATAGAGLDPALLALLAGLGAAAQQASAPTSAATPATPSPAKRVARARIASVKLSANRKRLTVRVTCPASAPAAGCRIAPTAKLAGRSVKLSGTRTVKRGRTSTLKGRVAAATVKKLRAKGGKAVVRVRTVGATAGAVRKTVTVRRVAR